MSSSSEIAQLEAKLHKAKADKARQDAKVKPEVEHKVEEECQITEEKVVVKAKSVAEEEQRRVEVAAVEVWQIAEERTAVARGKAILEAEAKWKAEAEWQAEEMEAEQCGGWRVSRLCVTAAHPGVLSVK